MPEVNNFDQIKKMLDFSDPDKFYFVQLLKRPTDGHNITLHGINVDNYFISSMEYFDKKIELIKEKCEYWGARAYIRLNRRSHEKTALKSAQLLLEFIDNNTPELTRKVFLKTCGRHHAEPRESKTWIIDIDEQEDVTNISDIIDTINSLQPSGQKIIETIHTKKGLHLISYPFNVMSFQKIYPNIDVHKDNPTVLYIPEMQTEFFPVDELSREDIVTAYFEESVDYDSKDELEKKLIDEIYALSDSEMNEIVDNIEVDRNFYYWQEIMAITSALFRRKAKENEKITNTNE